MADKNEKTPTSLTGSAGSQPNKGSKGIILPTGPTPPGGTPQPKK
jgi:hypothetical protein